MSKREPDEVTGVETTGHEWDGIRELDNPLPRWWLYMFWAGVVVAAVY
ncbi:MAG: cytochrome C oxidase Cbb3, partial [Chitinophagaceae bacterium]